jgi:hypothetical protein
MEATAMVASPDATSVADGSGKLESLPSFKHFASRLAVISPFGDTIVLFALLFFLS